jgi:hypothetical protein
VIASAWGLGAAGAEESPYDLGTAEEAAPQLYDEASSSAGIAVAGRGGAGPEIGDKAGNVAAWLRLATMPISETGLTREAVTELLLGDEAARPGAFCFRPSSKGNNTVVLCVMIQARDAAKGVLGSTANIRLVSAGGGSSSVSVHDLTPKPIEFAGMAAVLAHFADPTSEPQNSSAITTCIKAPAGLVAGASAIGSFTSGAGADGVYGEICFVHSPTDSHAVSLCLVARALSNRLACGFPLLGCSCAQATTSACHHTSMGPTMHITCCGPAFLASCSLWIRVTVSSGSKN